MIYRQLIEDLEKWSQRPNGKPLVLRGARQVGKTTLIDEFGKLQFIPNSGDFECHRALWNKK